MLASDRMWPQMLLLAKPLVVLVMVAAASTTALTPSTAPSTRPAALIQTDTGGTDRLTRKADLVFTQQPSPASDPRTHFTNLTNTNANSTVVAVDLDTVLSMGVVGFGGAFTEAMAVALNGLHNASLRREVLEAYFGEDGLQYSLCRVHINSCDYSLGEYSDDDVPGDTALAHFDPSHEHRYLIPLISEAQQVRRAWGGPDFALFASAWSPPAWMKENDNMLGKFSLRGGGVRPEYAGTWALYLSKWLDAYNSSGIDFSMMTVQNEPTNYPCDWDACHFTAEQETAFVRDHLGPLLRERHPGVRLLGLDDNKSLLDEWAAKLFGSGGAGAYLDGVGVHWYTGDWFEAVTRFRIAHPGKLVIATEACTGPGVVYGEWTRGEKYSHDIIGDLNAGANGWVDWNMALRVVNCTNGTDRHPCPSGPNPYDPVADDSPIIIDTGLQKVTRQPQYWYLGHFTKFAPVGRGADVFVAATTVTGAHKDTTDSPAIEATALYNGTHISCVILNRSPHGAVAGLEIRLGSWVASNLTMPRGMWTVVMPLK